MLSSSVLEDTNVVRVAYDGGLAQDEMIDIRRRIEAVIDERGSARLLVEYGDVVPSRIEPAAAWQDLKSADLLGGVERVALLAHQRWLQGFGRLAGDVGPYELEVFERTHRDKALGWLRS